MENINKEQKRVVTFLDESNTLFTLEVGLTYRNGYAEFYVRGENGQNRDKIEGRTGEQIILLNMWAKHHIKDVTSLMPSFWDEIESLIDDIEEDEKERKEASISSLEMYETKTDTQGESLLWDTLEDLGIDEIETAIAICLHFGLNKSELEDIEENGDNEWVIQGREYLAGTEYEIEKHAIEYIRNSLWAFNVSFLSDWTGLPEVIFTALQPMCEDANEAIEELLGDAVEEFAKKAIATDGIGHFLNSYDGNHEEIHHNGELYIIVYRG